MVPSSADIVIQNCRISQSETSARTIRDVVNIILPQRAQVNGVQNVTSPVFSVIDRLRRHLDISQRMNHAVRSDVT